MKTVITTILLALFRTHLWAQDSTAMKKYDVLPIITYSPDTELNLGIIGFRYFDFSKGIKGIQHSFVNASAIYTTRKQLFLELSYQFFFSTKNRMDGWTYFFDAPDRNYGLGNDARLLVFEHSSQDTLNYLNVDVKRYGFIGNFQKNIGKGVFLGPSIQIENILAYDTIPDSFRIIQEAKRLNYFQNRIEGKRIGFGVTLTFDTRDQIINTRSGHFLRFSNLINSKIFGSDFEYNTMRVELAKYINTIKNHTLAFRIIQNWKHPISNDGDIPLYGLSRPDSRGYIRGTFQDCHSQQIDIEYRLPFWRDEALDDPNFRFWKGLGMVVFMSGQQAYGETGGYQLSNTNLAMGGGFRILLNRKNRLNLRIDYAIGLLENGNGVDGRQTAFTFNLSEAF